MLILVFPDTKVDILFIFIKIVICNGLMLTNHEYFFLLFYLYLFKYSYYLLD